MRLSNLLGKGLFLVLGLILIDSLPLIAQEKKQTKVTIIKETYDEQGNKQVQKIVKEGPEAEAIDIDRLAEGTYQKQYQFKGLEDLQLPFGDFENFDFGQGEIEQFQQFFDSLNFGFRFFDDGQWSSPDDWLSLKPLDDKASKPKLGIQINSLESESGVLVTHVIPDSPADRAGILEGDIILSVDHQLITTPEALVEYIQDRSSDDAVLIDLRRGEEHIQVEATLTQYKPKKDIEIRKI